MRLLGLEIKRVLKTRITWVILLGIMVCSILFAYIPVTFVYYMDENGQNYEGIEALSKYKEVYQDLSGEATHEKFQNVTKTVQKLYSEYNVTEYYELPDEVYLKEYLPISPFVSRLENAYINAESEHGIPVSELDAENLTDFYSACDSTLDYKMQGNTDSAKKMAKEHFSKVSKPYLYYPGITSDALDYETFLLFLLLLGCGVIAAPIFASEYQTEADSILRCTKYGKTRLAVTKIISAFIISGMAFCVATITWLVVTNSLFGWESTKTSTQMIMSVTALVNWNVGQLQWGAIGIAALSFFAALSFILFVSAKCKSLVSAMVIGIFSCIIPVFWTILPDKLALWIRCLWTTGAVGLQNGIIYDLTGYHFLNAGAISIWVPYAIMIFAIIEIPLFIGLTIRAYNRHTVN